LNNERLSWSSNTSVGAYASPLKWTLAGYRHYSTGSLNNVGTDGYYWSSTVTVAGTYSNFLLFYNHAFIQSYYRAFGLSVRCLKDVAAAVGSLNCAGATTTGTPLWQGSALAGVSTTVSYTGGNAGSYSAQTVNSTGVTGLTASLSAGSVANGNGSISYTITGTPATSGTASFAISLGGQSCTFTIAVAANQAAQYSAGSTFCVGGPTGIVDVTNPTTGVIWMDRNLGASQVASSSTDQNAYGDLYQWGRRTDGHQCRTSATTGTLSSVDQPAHGNFILTSNAPYDWRSPQNTNLWQGVNGVNNPCPSGYRLPTETELNNEHLSWSSQNSAGAYASPLKWTLAGLRYYSDGSLGFVGAYGIYWSSTVSGTNSRHLLFENGAGMGDDNRALGLTVRCVKN
jgi:uncharacterized protein (TIGR02145 family)